MKKIALWVVALSLVGIQPAGAEICSLDNGLAATLLLPYFEVDLDRPFGQTTLMAIGNGASTPQLVNVVIWTDLGVPMLSFNLYLTGFDVHTINLRDLFSTDVAQNTGPTVTPAGPFSSPNIDFPGCDGFFPGPPRLPNALVAHVRASLTGGPSAVFEGLCSGQSLGDHVARGFVTVDLIQRCVVDLPTAPGYFGENGVVAFNNVLFGDYFYIDVAENFAQGESLIRLQADPAALGPGDLTFYGGLTGYDGSDAREPLPERWGARYLLGGDLDLDTDLVVWRDPMAGPRAPFGCGDLPFWYPLSQGSAAVLAFDEEENAEDPTLCPVCSPPFSLNFAPAVAQRVSLQTDLFVSFEAGWLNLDLAVPQLLPQPPSPPFPVLLDQAAVVSLVEAQGRFSVGFDATPLSEACRTANLP